MENTGIGETGRGAIVLYQTADGKTSLDVKLENETVWLSQAQMANLFEKDQSVIARHIKNALAEGEMGESNMQILHNSLSKYRPTTVYNLDVIISVGYRVHSQRGVQFRRWANTVLKDYIVKGYAIRNVLLEERYYELRSLVDTMGKAMQYLDTGYSDQIKSIFDVVKDYTYALDTLDSYDYQTLEIAFTSGQEKILPPLSSNNVKYNRTYFITRFVDFLLEDMFSCRTLRPCVTIKSSMRYGKKISSYRL
ncbi:MAG: virulence RhuM family protein [Bacteroidales bacterium]|nr:virulence RhuM family protein [Bacteroidales bacterium]